MARRWRIRHKLMLGLGLVVAIMGLLVGGTLTGLLSYMTTMKTMDSKVAELQKANNLKVAVNRLAEHPDPDAPVPYQEEALRLRGKMEKAREALDDYKTQLDDTLQRHRDPEGGVLEIEYIEALKQRFQRLDQAIDNFNGVPKAASGATPRLREDSQVDEIINDLVRSTEDLQHVIYQNLSKRSTASKGYYRISLIIVLSTSVLGVLLMAGLLRFFYRWVFYPVRDLEQGACRVAQGDFEHRIDVHSGDEMEELADAFNDMTGRLREIYRDLNRQVNERSRQLVRSERLASVGFLAAGVAHEINNPLQAITLYSGALEARLADLMHRQGGNGQGARQETSTPIPSEEYEVIAKYLRTILEEAFRCKRITERLLEFSRGGERHREPIDLTELMQSVLDVAQPLPNARGKIISFEPTGQVTAWANADEIKSVALNLVVNALDSMDDGGKLTIQLRPQGDMAEMVLTDTGCGMNAEVLENIFEPFFTKSRHGKGTGLGLTISHRIITQHGGEIEAASPGPDQGSSFTVRLPRHPAEEPATGKDGDTGQREPATSRRLAA